MSVQTRREKLAAKRAALNEEIKRLDAQARTKAKVQERKNRTRAAIVAGTHIMNYSKKILPTRLGGGRHRVLRIIFAELIGTRDHALVAEYFPLLIEPPKPLAKEFLDEGEQTMPS